MTLLDTALIVFGITFMFPLVCFALSVMFWITFTIFGGKN